jgi:hypothetical protein
VDQPLKQLRLSIDLIPGRPARASASLPPASTANSSAVAAQEAAPKQPSTRPLAVTHALIMGPEAQDAAHAKRGREGDDGPADEGEERGAPKAR